MHLCQANAINWENTAAILWHCSQNLKGENLHFSPVWRPIWRYGKLSTERRPMRQKTLPIDQWHANRPQLFHPYISQLTMDRVRIMYRGLCYENLESVELPVRSPGRGGCPLSVQTRSLPDVPRRRFAKNQDQFFWRFMSQVHQTFFLSTPGIFANRGIATRSLEVSQTNLASKPRKVDQSRPEQK